MAAKDGRSCPEGVHAMDLLLNVSTAIALVSMIGLLVSSLAFGLGDDL
jgi:hypothetical protein